MIYKYNFSVSGEFFFPEKVLGSLQGEIIINSYFKPTDKKPVNPSEEYGYGNISFWHPKKYSTESEVAQYDNHLVDFLTKNHSLLIENKATEFEIFIEIYFDGEQCNFEIFNKGLLKKLSELEVSLPISIYLIDHCDLRKWEDEIKLVWQPV